MRLKLLLYSLLFFGQKVVALPMVKVPAGRLELFVPEQKVLGGERKVTFVPVAAFEIDQHPVTNQEFLDFLLLHSRWQRDHVSALFADQFYLSHWLSPLKPGSRAPPNSPVVFVSWFAARAYCQAQGKRLPTTDEWEYAAGPEFFGATANDRQRHTDFILEWYSKPSAGVLPAVGSSNGHRLRLQDLYGLIWEWTEDFSSSLATTESRDNAAPGAAEFCGAGALGGKDPNNYASYMRFAFRNSLKGGFSLANLGFRCAQDSAP